MSAEFRIVHYITDPFLGARIPVAALVRRGTSVTLVRARHVPDAECLGGTAQAATLRMILENLDVAESFDELPLSVGPFAVMAEPMPVPGAVDDAEDWIVRHVLPAPPAHELSRNDRPPHRASFGYEFFKRQNVERYVKKRFDLHKQWTGLFGQKQPMPGATTSTDTVSHWVDGANKLLLMEPLIPHRPSFERDLHSVARNFSAFRYHLDELGADKNISLVAYILRSNAERRRAQARDALVGTAHVIIDLSMDAEQKTFIDSIRAVGESRQLALGLT